MTKHRAKTTLSPKFEPIQLNGFTLTEKGMKVKGRPSLPEYQGTFDFVTRVHKLSGFWLVDLIAYADKREDWKEQIDQIIDAEVLTENSVRQYRWLGKHMLDVDDRVTGVDFGNHAVVAALPHEEQIEWLERSRSEGWTQQELRSNVQAAERTKVIDGQAVLAGMFRVIYADPPWKYGDSGMTIDGSLGKASSKYPALSIEQLCALPVKAHALPDSILFLWVTNPLLLQNPGPRDVIEAWGFEYKSSFGWDKVLGMRGHYNHVVHEHLLICTRGSCLPDVPTPQPKSIQTIRRSTEHSAKPDEFRSIITTHWNRGPYLELFGRKKVEGWSVFGNDARLWSDTNGKAPITINDEDVPF